MIFYLTHSAGVPVCFQLMLQVRHAVERRAPRHGDSLPGIRTLAQQLVVSHNTVATAYSELQHEGLIELRHGSGAYVSARRGSKSREEKLRQAQQRVRTLMASLREDGLSEEAIARLFEAELLYTPVR